MNGRAFTLIELIVYMGILSLLTFFVFDYWSVVNKSIVSSVKVPTLGLEILRRDVIQASDIWSEWATTPAELVFIKKQLHHNGVYTAFAVSWRIDKKRLVRSNGIYDFNTKRWVEKRSAVIAKDAQSFTWKCIKNNDESRVERTEIIYTPAHGISEKLVIRLRNRVLT